METLRGHAGPRRGRRDRFQRRRAEGRQSQEAAGAWLARPGSERRTRLGGSEWEKRARWRLPSGLSQARGEGGCINNDPSRFSAAPSLVRAKLSVRSRPVDEQHHHSLFSLLLRPLLPLLPVLYPLLLHCQKKPRIIERASTQHPIRTRCRGPPPEASAPASLHSKVAFLFRLVRLCPVRVRITFGPPHFHRRCISSIRFPAWLPHSRRSMVRPKRMPCDLTFDP